MRMNNRVTYFLRCVTALLMLALSSAPYAAISAVVATPNQVNVATGQATSFTVTWFVTETAGPVSVVSTEGIIQDSDGTRLLRVATPLSRVANSGQTVVITETVFVPASVGTTAQRRGMVNVTYSRLFNDGGVPVPGVVNLFFVSSSVAGFGVTREALSFDDGTPVRIVQRNDKLHAKAELTVTGTGLLQAVWEIASPPSTQGEPFYRSLAQVNQPLNHGDRNTIESPALPTSLTGIHLLRLRITNPLPGFDAPVIRYFVGEGRPGHGMPPTPISLERPANLALLDKETQFSWQAVKEARIYQLEIYKATPGVLDSLPDIGGSTGPSAAEMQTVLSHPPITGVLVPADKTKTVLSTISRGYLIAGQRYYWRLLAIDLHGVIIAMSPLRELRVP